MAEHVSSGIEQFLTDRERRGTKFLAQRLFKNLGLIDIAIDFRPSPWEIDDVAAAAARIIDIHGAVIIRTSTATEINLPWKYAANLRTVAAFLTTVPPQADVMITQYTVLEYSGEFFLSDSDAIIQVMPGIWEIDSEASPDSVTLLGSGNREILHHDVSRRAVYLDAEGRRIVREAAPTTPRVLDAIADSVERHLPLFEQLRSHIWNPLHLYFHTDSTLVPLFQNIRRPYSISVADMRDKPADLYIVSSIDDIQSWDGISPILFQVVSPRGEAARIVACIDAARRRGIDTVFTSAGLLSHQAILLREAGIRVLDVIPT